MGGGLFLFGDILHWQGLKAGRASTGIEVAIRDHVSEGLDVGLSEALDHVLRPQVLEHVLLGLPLRVLGRGELLAVEHPLQLQPVEHQLHVLALLHLFLYCLVLSQIRVQVDGGLFLFFSQLFLIILN